MNTHELYQHMSEKLFIEIFDYLYQKEKQALNLAIQTLAVSRKLRPVFIQRKAKVDRARWVKVELAKKLNHVIGGNFLQYWFIGTQNEMLCCFLDNLGIAHKNNGEVDEMPEDVEKEKLATAVNALFEKYDPEKLVLYLHALISLEMVQWPALVEMLASDARLALPLQVSALNRADSSAQAVAPAAQAQGATEENSEPEA